jgi:hypothetical protein
LVPMAAHESIHLNVPPNGVDDGSQATGIPFEAPPDQGTAILFKPPPISVAWIWTGYSPDPRPWFRTMLPEPIKLLDADDAQTPNEGSQPTISTAVLEDRMPKTTMNWMYLDDAKTAGGTEGEYLPYWQMVDEPFHDRLNKKMDDCEAGAELTCDNWTYKVDLEKMEMTRTLKKTSGETRALIRVEMIGMEGSRPDRKVVLHGWESCRHWQFVWQYKSFWGWKNFEPMANHQALWASYSHPTVTVTYVWEHSKKGALKETYTVDYTVDFQAMTMKAKGRKKKQIPVRLVAYRTPVVEVVVV